MSPRDLVPAPLPLLGEGFAAWFSVTPGWVTSEVIAKAHRQSGRGPRASGLFWAVWLVQPPGPGTRTPYSWGIAQTRAEVVDVMEAEAWVTLQSTAPFGELDPSFAEAAFRLHESVGRREPPEVPFGPKSASQRWQAERYAKPPTPRRAQAPAAPPSPRPASPEVEAQVLALRRELRKRIALERMHPDQGGDPALLKAVVAEYEVRIAAVRSRA